MIHQIQYPSLVAPHHRLDIISKIKDLISLRVEVKTNTIKQVHALSTNIKK